MKAKAKRAVDFIFIAIIYMRATVGRTWRVHNAMQGTHYVRSYGT